MKLGCNGVLPFKVGGAPAPHTVAYQVLRDAMGVGGSGEPGSIVEAWRTARARGLAAVMLDKRAAMQAFPQTATCSIPVFERLLGMSFLRGVSEQEKRDALTPAWIDAGTISEEDLTDAIAAIIPTVTLYRPDHDVTRETQHGRAFEDWDPNDAQASGPAFNLSIKGTRFANYADDFVVFVDLGIVTTLGLREFRNIAAVKERLHSLLPAWVDFTAYNSLGFVLDEDFLDLTAFSE